MNTFQQLVLPSLVLPLALSAAGLLLTRQHPAWQWVLPLIWLPAGFWLTDGAALRPQEANDWLWLLLLTSLVLQVSTSRFLPPKAAWPQTALLSVALILLSWPVLTHQPDYSLVAELFAVLLAGAVILHTCKAEAASAPALTLAASSGGLALVTALGGSLLIGQLAAALAASLGAFALYELYLRLTSPSVGTTHFIPLLQVYLALLVIARLYAGIPLVSAALLLAAPALGLFSQNRFAAVGSTLCATTALLWLLFTADASSYY